MNLTEQKMKLVGIYNSLQEKIDAYWLKDIAISSWPLKDLCAKRDEVERQIKELNKLLNIKDD